MFYSAQAHPQWTASPLCCVSHTLVSRNLREGTLQAERPSRGIHPICRGAFGMSLHLSEGAGLEAGDPSCSLSWEQSWRCAVPNLSEKVTTSRGPLPQGGRPCLRSRTFRWMYSTQFQLLSIHCDWSHTVNLCMLCNHWKNTLPSVILESCCERAV